MKRLIILPVIIMIIGVAQVDAFVEKRYEWWNLRVKRLENLYISLNKDRHYDEKLKELLKKDIKTGRDFIALHNRRIFQNIETLKDPGLLTKGGLEGEIKKIIRPLVAFYYLEQLVKDAGSNEVFKRARETVKEEIGEVIRKNTGLSDMKAVKFVTENMIGHGDWKQLSMELTMITCLNNMENILETMTETLTGTVMFNIKNMIVGLNPAEFHMRITDWGINAIHNLESKKSEISFKDALDKSFIWKNIYRGLMFLTERVDGSPARITGYLKNSEKLLNFINNIKNKKNIEKADVLGNMLRINRNFLKHISNLVKKSAAAGIYSYPFLEKRINGIYSRINDIYRYLASTSGITKDELKAVPEKSLKTLTELKSEYTNDIRNIKTEITDDYRLLSKRIRSFQEKTRKLGKSLEKYTAGEELNMLFSLIEDYAALYRKYNYIEDIFKSYAGSYMSMLKLANSRKINNEARKIKGNYSVFNELKEFDEDKIEREKIIKRLIKKEGNRLVSVLSSLISFYKRNRVEVKYYPSAESVSELKNIFNNKSLIKIEYWTMTPENFRIIDRNVSAHLKRIISSNVWLGESKKNSGDDKLSVYSVKVRSIPMTLDIPSGWLEERLTGTDRSRGLFKKYRSVDKSSRIGLAKIDSGSDSSMGIKTACEKWAMDTGHKPVMKKWGKKGSQEYYWILSKDSAGTLNEIYAISKNGYTYILSGISDSEKYRFFREKMNSIFNSISFRM